MSNLSDASARRLRSGKPFHLPPAAQPLRAQVTLVLEDLSGSKQEPLIVLTDTRRAYQWQVVMLRDSSTPGRWTADIRLPAEPTIVKYHFLVGELQIMERRQVEGHNRPVYGEWTELEFKIAVYDPARMPAPWTQGMVMYQIFPDRFASSDPGRQLQHGGVYGMDAKFMRWGEAPEAPPLGRDFFGGDLRGITGKLDYLHDLGIETLYLNPIFEAVTNHRYEAIDFMRIDPMLGTEADFDDLLREAHARGMKVVLDAVFNHCSSDSIYFDITGKQTQRTGVPGASQSRQSPYYRWFKFKRWPGDYDGWYDYGFMPEFVECPEMEDYFLGENGVTRTWLRRGIDGWRADVPFDNTDVFWKRFRDAVDAEQPGAYTISEEWRDSTHYLLGDQFSATMNYRFAWAVRGYLATHDLLPSELDDRLQIWLRDTPGPAINAQMNLLDSHDSDRLLTACGGDRQKFKQALAFQLTYIGAPCIYYGAETGLEGSYAEEGRVCMPWDHLDAELHGYVRHLVHTRNASPALRYGEVQTVVIDDERRVYGFVRRTPEQTVYVAFNASATAAQVELPLAEEESGTYHDLFNGLAAVEARQAMLSFELPAFGIVAYTR